MIAATKKRVNKTDITLVRGDITRQEVDAIVNAANSGLLGGGGVDGAIHRAGGPEILAECKEIRDRQGTCPTGQAVITGGGNLKARFVIHAVGPIWRGGTGEEEEKLASAYRSSLALAVESGARTVAFPSISTGAYGFPVKKASAIAIKVTREFLESDSFLSEVRFVLFDNLTYECFKNSLQSAIQP